MSNTAVSEKIDDFHPCQLERAFERIRCSVYLKVFWAENLFYVRYSAC